jgi:glucokinase
MTIMTVEKPFVVGVDVGGTNVRAAVVEHGTGKIVARSLNIPSHAMDGAQYTVQQIAEGVRQAMENAATAADQVGGVGIAVPGHVKPDEGKILWAPNFKDQWHDVLLAQPVSDL